MGLCRVGPKGATRLSPANAARESGKETTKPSPPDWVTIGSVSKLRIVADYFSFLREQKKWWMLPIAAVLVLFGVLIVLAQGSALAPFIYALF